MVTQPVCGLCEIDTSLRRCACTPRRSRRSTELRGPGQVSPAVERRQAVNAEGVYRRDHLISHGLLRAAGILTPEVGDAPAVTGRPGISPLCETIAFAVRALRDAEARRVDRLYDKTRRKRSPRSVDAPLTIPRNSL